MGGGGRSPVIVIPCTATSPNGLPRLAWPAAFGNVRVQTADGPRLVDMVAKEKSHRPDEGNGPAARWRVPTERRAGTCRHDSPILQGSWCFAAFRLLRRCSTRTL